MTFWVGGGLPPMIAGAALVFPRGLQTRTVVRQGHLNARPRGIQANLRALSHLGILGTLPVWRSVGSSPSSWPPGSMGTVSTPISQAELTRCGGGTTCPKPWPCWCVEPGPSRGPGHLGLPQWALVFLLSLSLPSGPPAHPLSGNSPPALVPPLLPRVGNLFPGWWLVGSRQTKVTKM